MMSHVLPRRVAIRGYAYLAASLFGFAVIPWPPLALAALAIWTVLAVRDLPRALVLLPLTFPYWYVPRPLVGSAVFPVSEVALLTCAFAAMIRVAWRVAGPHPPAPSPIGEGGTLANGAGPRHKARRVIAALVRRVGPGIVIGAALLFVGVSLGVLVADRPREALRAWRWEALEPLLYLALVVTFVRGRELTRVLVGSYLVTALLLAVLAAVQVLWLHVTFAPLAQGNALVPYMTAPGDVPRATAFVLVSGNHLGAWMARALPLALALAIVPTRRTRTTYFAVLCGLACILALLWSASRGALLAAAGACAVVGGIWLWSWASKGQRRALLTAAGTAGVLLMLAAVIAGKAILDGLLAGHGGSGEMRLLIWLAALRMIQDHPLLGIGPDQFLYHYGSRYTTAPYWITVLNGRRTPAWREPNVAQPHNLPLDLWLSGGLLALAGFTLALVAFWRRCWRLWRSAVASARDGGWRAAVALGIGASVLAGILHGMVDSAYFAPDMALLFWWSVAVIVVLPRDQESLHS